jgi:hypothetical protein
LLEFLLAHIGVPFVAGVALVLFEAVASTEALSWDGCNAIGLDFAILSIGATGAIFVNPRLIDHWGERTACSMAFSLFS